MLWLMKVKVVDRMRKIRTVWSWHKHKADEHDGEKTKESDRKYSLVKKESQQRWGKYCFSFGLLSFQCIIWIKKNIFVLRKLSSVLTTHRTDHSGIPQNCLLGDFAAFVFSFCKRSLCVCWQWIRWSLITIKPRYNYSQMR